MFRTIVDEGSFAAAARRLRLSPASISKNVAELEAALGVRLFHRTTRRLSLTEAGETYSDRVARVLTDLEEADQAVIGMSGGVHGRLRVSAPLTLGLLVVSPAIPHFLQRHPGLTLDLDLDDRRVDMVREGFDLVLRGSPALEDSSLIARKLATLDYAVCASPDYLQRRGMPAQPADLRDHDLVQFSLPRRWGPWKFEKDGEQAELAVTARYAVTSSLAVRDALTAGLGVGRIPRLYVREDLAAGRLVELLPGWSTGSFDLFAIYPSRQHAPPKVAAFLDFMVEIFQSLGGEGRA